MIADFSQCGEHTIQYTDDGLWNCTPETYAILLTNVTPINPRKRKEKINIKLPLDLFLLT